MADDVPITAGVGTSIATDDVGSVHYQKIKIALGADGAIDTLVDSGQQTMANSVPVVLASDQAAVPVTASAGTNLNTSALALEAGGNLAAAAASLSVIDDWDETDRAKVNTIAGQVGVQGASGTVTSLTQRVVLATDVALPAGTNGIGKLTANAGVTIGAVEIVAAQTLATLTTLTGGGVAHSAADSGNPVKVGGRSISALPTNLVADDRTDDLANLVGQKLVGHIDSAMQVQKSASYTSTQTGAVLWDPTSGKRFAITSIILGSFGTTAARVIIWIGANADTTYSAGTDQLVCAVSFAPSTTSKPGMVFAPYVPIFSNTADNELHVTTDAAISIDIAVYGYEF